MFKKSRGRGNVLSVHTHAGTQLSLGSFELRAILVASLRPFPPLFDTDGHEALCITDHNNRRRHTQGSRQSRRPTALLARLVGDVGSQHLPSLLQSLRHSPADSIHTDSWRLGGGEHTSGYF